MNYWKYHDEKMRELKQIYNKVSKQKQNNLQALFDTFNFSYETLYDIANAKTKRRINNYIEQWKDKGLLKGYFGVLAKNIYSRTRVKNSEVLELLIYYAYVEEQNQLEEKERSIFKEDTNYYYEQGQKEVIKAQNKNKETSVIPDAIFLALMNSASYNNLTWKQYIEATILYNVQQIYKQAVYNLQQQKELEFDSDEFANIIQRQDNQKLNINGDKISGAVDLNLIGLNNQAKAEGIYSFDDKAKVRFVAVEDEATTPMCRSLDGQKFYIHDWNNFKRHSKTKDSVIECKCYGLIVGLNCPPVTDGFHFCRSTIVYNTNYISKDFRNGNILGEEQYKALEQYLKSASYKINAKLYEGKELSNEDKKYIERLDEALKEMPIYKGWVKRSVYVRDNEDVSKILSIFDNEQRIGHWNSYISSSLGVYDTSFKMIMNIKSKTGRNLSILNDEGGGEILFMRNTDFQLIDIENKDGIIYVKLEEV